jgi:predicted transcriptional regulator
MDIQAEKLHLIEQLAKLQNASIVSRVKDFLHNALKEKDELLEQSIERGIKQSKAGQVHPHKEVMAEMRAKYGA